MRPAVCLALHGLIPGCVPFSSAATIADVIRVYTSCRCSHVVFMSLSSFALGFLNARRQARRAEKPACHPKGKRACPLTGRRARRQWRSVSVEIGVSGLAVGLQPTATRAG